MFQFFTTKIHKLIKLKAIYMKGSFLNIEFDKRFDICISKSTFYHCDVIKVKIKV